MPLTIRSLQAVLVVDKDQGSKARVVSKTVESRAPASPAP